MLKIKKPLAKWSAIVNWYTFMQVNTLSKYLPTQDLINLYMYTSTSAGKASLHIVFSAVALNVWNAAVYIILIRLCILMSVT